MEFGILGPLELHDERGAVDVRGAKPQTVLAMLLLHANQPVSAESLAEALWGDQAPANGHRTVHVYVSRLRRVLGDSDLLASTSAGYRLRVRPGELDAERFERLVEEGERLLAVGQPARAARVLRDALALWRGAPLAELGFESFAASAVARLEELRLVALETCMDAEMELGRHRSLIPELEALSTAHPTRERVAAQLMVALYRCGRQADALEAYQRTRRRLVEELGLEPGPALKALQQAVLDQAPSLELSASAQSGASVLETPEPDTAAGSCAPVSSSIPVPPTRTIGRRAELEAVTSLLKRTDVRLVTLTGPGGVGKTRLALGVTSAIAGDFADGAWWVELASVARAEDVAMTIANALTVAVLPGESPGDALRRFLASKRLLLAIDNFEHVLDAADLVHDLLAASPELKVLATSREALSLSAEHSVEVEPLPVPPLNRRISVADVERAEATAVFLAAARRYDNRFEVDSASAPVVARICARLDGLPLAIELAAARVRLLGPEGVLARLDDDMFATGAGPRDAPDRQRTLRATIEWSHGLLEPEQQLAFSRLAVFAGGATIHAAEAVTGARLESLDALIAKHLLHLEHEPGGERRLSMLATVRTYALTRFVDDPGHDAIRRRHCDHYYRLVERNAPMLERHGEQEALRVLDRDIDNIRGALDWALAVDPATALRLAARMRRYWRIRAAAPEGLRWLDAGLRAAGNQLSIEDQAEAELARSDLLDLVDDVEGARRAAHAALRHYRRARDDGGVAEALCAVAANGLLGIPQLQLVRTSAEAAYRHAHAIGSEYLMARALAVLTPALPPEERLSTLERAEVLLLRLGHYSELAVSYANTAYSAILEGRSDEALALAEKAMTVAEAYENPNITMLAAANLGVAALLCGDFERARAALRRQLRLCGEHSFRWQATEGFAGLAAVAAHDGAFDRAGRLWGAARAIGKSGSEDVLRRIATEYIAPVQVGYGDERWSYDQSAGATMSFEQAIDYALDTTDGAQPSPRVTVGALASSH